MIKMLMKSVNQEEHFNIILRRNYYEYRRERERILKSVALELIKYGIMKMDGSGSLLHPV